MWEGVYEWFPSLGGHWFDDWCGGAKNALFEILQAILIFEMNFGKTLVGLRVGYMRL